MSETPKKKGGWQPGQSGNPRGRPLNTAVGVHAMRQIVGEKGFKEIVEALSERAKQGDAAAANLLLSRMAPQPRSAPEPIQVNVVGDTPADRCESVIGSMTAGEISIEQGRLLLESIIDLTQMRQLEALNERLDRLESKR